MPELSFRVEGADLVQFAIAPTLALKLRIDNAIPQQRIESIMLQCQVQIEATRRRYATEEQPRLLDLFGEPERWGKTVRTMLWTNVTVNVRPFTDSTLFDLHIPCTFDFNVAATKYFHALDAGEVPLALLFSGTIFYDDEERGLQVTQIPWNREANYRLPVAVWRQVIDHYYPNTSWLTVRRDVFDRLNEFKMRNSIATWDQALERLLAQTVSLPS